MDAAIFGLLLFFVMVPLFLAFLVLPLYCIIDAAQRSSADFERADSNKTLWIVLPFVFGILAAVVYLVVVRPRVRSVAN